MDAPTLLRHARHRAGLTKRALAAAAGTSPSAVVEYEKGRRSPTVATLDRLLAACGLQVRAVLEPYLADLDAAVDALLAADAQGLDPDDVATLADGLTAGGVTWAFDAETALVLHGLAAPAPTLQVVVVGDLAVRSLFASLGVQPYRPDGEPIWLSWVDPLLELARLGVCSGYTRIGVFEARVVETLPPPVRVEIGGRAVPVLPLLEVEVAHPRLADVLGRLRHRRTVTA